ncbi:MAG: hypothetical protein AAF481_04970 [Acidobacteriota bacterium]
MTKKTHPLAWITLFALALFVSGPVAVDSSASSCTGTLYTYYETSACQVIVGSKVSCPGFPDEWDEDPDGNRNQTPYFTTQTVTCPCSGGGGGGGGGGDTDDSDDWG